MSIITYLFAVILANSLSPAEISIRKAQEQIEKHPEHAAYYNALAMAYARRAREISDVQFYTLAEQTLDKSFAIAPDNFDGLKVKTWLLLGRHEFAKARELAARLNKQNPDDISVYAYLADANVELGNYGDAVKAAQWMLDLRPDNIAGLARAAYLRELHGDAAGAIELMQSAYDATPFQEAEERGWLLTQIAHLHFLRADLRSAEAYAQRALATFPDYRYALAALAQVRMAQRRPGDAVALLEKRYSVAPHAENLYALAEALDAAGRKDEAASAFAEFERKAMKESMLADNANRELVAYYADVAKDSQKALALAEREYAVRQDVFTLDAYAWACAKNGDYARADEAICKALKPGIKEPRMLYHAGVIAVRLGDTGRGRELLTAAASLYSQPAQAMLAEVAR